ncbi:hypothetical protein [Candidatus Tisiphia endosymbiont of Hybos culiciformis]|uniref:hypothetical protein n=1 Tax=Candidatus Tisiphia endosymbiont of Hybos culiciformis TaxID=3139331 RepID=UPI003CCB4010
MGSNTHNNSGARANQSRRNNYPKTQYEEPQKVKVVRGDVSHTDIGDLLLQLAVLSMIKSDNTSFLKNTSSLLENHHSLPTKISHQPTSNDMTSVVTQNSHVHLNSLTQQSSVKSTKTSSTTTKIVKQVKASNQNEQLSSHSTANDEQSIIRAKRSAGNDNYVVDDEDKTLLMAFALDIKAIKQKIQNNPSITKLWIHNDQINSKNATPLGKMLDKTQINYLILDSNKLELRTAIKLVQMLKDSNVTTLELNNNHINSIEAANLGKALKGTKITSLFLQGDKLEVEGVIAFIEAIKENNVNLNLLNLKSNMINVEEAKYILPYLNGTKLTKVILDHNYILDENGKNIDNESTTTEGGFTITKEDATHTNEEPTPESYIASKEAMSLGYIIGKFLIVPVVSIVSAAATIAGCVTYINNKFCNDKKVESTSIAMETDASQEVNAGQRQQIVYKRHPQEQSPESIPPTSHNNNIYDLSSVRTKPLPTRPGHQPAGDEIDSSYEQIGVYVTQSLEQQSVPRVATFSGTSDNTPKYVIVCSHIVLPAAGNDAIYLNMGGETGAAMTALQGGLTEYIESDC